MSTAQQFRKSKKLKIEDKAAAATPLGSGDKQADKVRVDELAQRIAELQDILYAARNPKLLVILQGMDTSGKDGTVKGVFGRIDPLGIRTVAFKAPTLAEKEHDYLWRIHQQVPGQGELVIFNRSHYEDVLVTRVHDWIDADECRRRCAQIRDFERMLAETGTTILKFFLHISKNEQRERLQARVDDPDKHWKFDPKDLEERVYWDSYQEAYQQAIEATDADHAPWYLIPADSKTHRNLAIASVVVETLEALKLSYPPPNPKLTGLKIA
ncbi:PPK2 family polyphosphate kinase [Noviherbaspirillum saxi]|uniref:Polyphosphate kinase 2 family protein n=1 Tax=Noviherbaspirillum saxi TaxID=2320863 RepID=A0A3A3FLY5_9BURK|nr:PPK2 family polyphosphate kinase [Noviherbaspirillum saxi]RJF97192.1 polyphosphate kinase 2 family protein [Noviherbaspirillum saxi]